jgi:hypothetical protein
MDQNRLRRICEMALDSRGVIVTEFRALPTQSFDHEKGDWVPHSYSLFLGVKRKLEPVLEKVGGDVTYRQLSSEFGDLERFLETLLGFECVVDFD